MARPVAAAVMCAVVVALAGCGGDGDSDLPEFGEQTVRPGATASPGGTPGPSDPASGDFTVGGTPPSSAGVAAHDAYVAFWRATLAALKDPRKQDAVLQLAADPQRARTAARLSSLRKKGQHAVGQLRVAPSSVVVKQRRATLRDCLDDSGLSLAEEDGTPVPGSAGNRRPVTAVLVSDGEDWLVSDIRVASGGC